jgi:hypothetical protein
MPSSWSIRGLTRAAVGSSRGVPAGAGPRPDHREARGLFVLGRRVIVAIALRGILPTGSVIAGSESTEQSREL